MANSHFTREWLDDHILGCFKGVCLGDAMGAATEQHQIDEILVEYGGMLRELVPPGPDTFSESEFAGLVTDDSSQMFAMCEAIFRTNGNLTTAAWTERLIDWSINSPLKHHQGPTTRQYMAALARGESTEYIGTVGRSTRKYADLGNTNGSAMRVAPAGMLNPGDIESAVRTAWITCLPTHDTHIAAAGAGAIAAGVSRALMPGADVYSVVKACLDGARLGEEIGRKEGRTPPGPSIVSRIEIAVEQALRARSLEDALRRIEATVGNSVLMVQSVPAAVGVFVAAGGDPVETAVGGTNIGNDSDTIAAMAGAMAGALSGSAAVPDRYWKVIEKANPEDISGMAKKLSDIVWARISSR